MVAELEYNKSKLLVVVHGPCCGWGSMLQLGVCKRRRSSEGSSGWFSGAKPHTVKRGVKQRQTIQTCSQSFTSCLCQRCRSFLHSHHFKILPVHIQEEQWKTENYMQNRATNSALQYVILLFVRFGLALALHPPFRPSHPVHNREIFLCKNRIFGLFIKFYFSRDCKELQL